MKKYIAVLGVFFLLCQPAFAGVEPGYDPSKPLVTTPWYGMVDAASKQADMDFITGMRPHHAGALTMSEEYLDSPDASSTMLKQLSRGIIRNQMFEIGMLDSVESHLSKLDVTEDRIYAQIATKDLSQQQRFYRSPIPGFLDGWGRKQDVSAEDVRFAKAMIIHHQAALDMAHAYLADPAARNGYLKKMCLDILLDQAQEIAFMESVIRRFPGNPEDVKISPSMIHGMDGMQHHESGHH